MKTFSAALFFLRRAAKSSGVLRASFSSAVTLEAAGFFTPSSLSFMAALMYFLSTASLGRSLRLAILPSWPMAARSAIWRMLSGSGRRAAFQKPKEQWALKAAILSMVDP